MLVFWILLGIHKHRAVEKRGGRGVVWKQGQLEWRKGGFIVEAFREIDLYWGEVVQSLVDQG